VDVNIFGLGINSQDAKPFFGSDFHMPAKWKSGKGVRPGPRATPHMMFALFGEGMILATVEYLGSSWRDRRLEHRPSDDGQRHDYGPGWVLDLDPNTWENQKIECDARGQSYRYGHLSTNNVFTQLTERRAAER
jgi:hypothetical protein